ncbi:MAG: 3-phosphoglycerate dehydrogenase [Erysipelotrichaceae bacterium]|nr:3-phosphoglycerate dehydrogenase [Erysipelotrichaceae bacterium]
MYKIKTYNKIAPVGLNTFTGRYEINAEETAPDAILVRSADLHEMPVNPELKAIARAGAGVNNIPVAEMSEKGIVVFNTPGANANAVKELVLLGMLMASRPVYESLNYTATLNPDDDVEKLVEKEKSKFKGNEIYGKTLGVIGLGAIGVKVCNAAADLGMKVIGFDPYMSVKSAWMLNTHVRHGDSIEQICRECDYISIHVPLNDKTRGMIGERELSLMKPTAVLLNMARGGIVDEAEVVEMLAEDKLAKYVVDFPSKTVIRQKNVIAIPHLGASTDESEDNCAVMAAEELMDFLENGNVTNSVNLGTISMPRSGEARITIFHHNVPNMLAQISEAVSREHINIENMMNKSKGDYAYTIVDVGTADNLDTVIGNLENINSVLRVSLYK